MQSVYVPEKTGKSFGKMPEGLSAAGQKALEEGLGTKRKAANQKISCFYGAGDEARTRYLHLGKVALYQMSYTRGNS